MLHSCPAVKFPTTSLDDEPPGGGPEPTAVNPCCERSGPTYINAPGEVTPDQAGTPEPCVDESVGEQPEHNPQDPQDHRCSQPQGSMLHKRDECESRRGYKARKQRKAHQRSDTADALSKNGRLRVVDHRRR